MDLINKQEAINEIRLYITAPNISDDETKIEGYGTNDLISRRDLIDALKQKLEDDYLDSYELLKYIKALPSVESERKKGEWIDGMLYQDFDESEWEKVKCSVCKRFIVKQIFYYDNKYHFCPYCGADMRGG